MGKVIAIAFGAGLASALLFIVSATASLLALLLAYLTPLPIMIAALGFGHSSGALAALVAGCTVGLTLGAEPGLVFFVLLGLPAWWLAYLVLLGRPVAAPAGGGAVSRDPPVEWYPLYKVVLWLAGVSAAPILALGVAVVIHYGGYDHALTALARKLAASFAGAALPWDYSFKDLLRAAPIAMAASTFLMLGFNLWLAGRIVRVSQRLVRPWPDLPASIRLPRLALAVFAAALLGSWLPDPLGLGLAVVAAAIGMAFAFAGLAIAHVLSRGLPARRLILGAIYGTVVILMPWPLLALALLGCIDCFVPLRNRPKRIPPTPTLRS